MLFLENWVLNLRNVSVTKIWAKWFLRKPNLETDRHRDSLDEQKRAL